MFMNAYLWNRKQREISIENVYIYCFDLTQALVLVLPSLK